MKKAEIKLKTIKMLRSCETLEQLDVATKYAMVGIKEMYPYPSTVWGILGDMFGFGHSTDYERDCIYKEYKKLIRVRRIIITNGELT